MKKLFDYIIVNDNLAKAVEEFKKMLSQNTQIFRFNNQIYTIFSEVVMILREYFEKLSKEKLSEEEKMYIYDLVVQKKYKASFYKKISFYFKV